MNELALKYGCNPNQKPSRIYMENGGDLPVTVLNGRPGYINFLDALNSIQLVFELKKALGMPAAASFKHVSPAGAALGLPLTDVERKMYHIDPAMELSPLACAYARARGADRMSSFGDWIALSDVCDVSTAQLIKHEVSDGIIAPGYEPEALAILASKKKGNYNVVAIDPAYRPAPIERKQVYGITFEQGRNELEINADTMLNNFVTENKTVTEEQKRDLVISLITLKYTQSNSVCYVSGGQTIGVGAGQQSRIHCTRLAGQKADNWQLRHMDKVLNLPFRDDVTKPNRDNAIDVYIGDTPEDVIGDDVWAETFTRQPEPLTAEEKKEYLSHVTGVCLGSDAFFPFGDNIERARRSGVTAIVQPGGSIRDQQVIDTCNKYGIAMAFCGLRLFITEPERGGYCDEILVVGGGGREHAIIRALKKSPACGEIWCAPGNGGISYDAKCKNIKATDVEAMVAFAKEEAFDYVVVAQDDPLALGMVDALAAVGIPAFGPDKAAARIEASKVFSKNLMKQYGIPTADYETFDDPAKAMAYIRARNRWPVVIKADGLALGKGVLICEDEAQAEDGIKEIMLDKKFGASGSRVVVEEFLTGPEVSV